jgi:hypothetical protein
LDADPEEMEAVVKWQEIPEEEATVQTFRALKKRMGTSIYQGSAAVSQRNGPRAMVGPGRTWLPPPGGSPAVQEWHGIRDSVLQD